MTDQPIEDREDAPGQLDDLQEAEEDPGSTEDEREESPDNE